MTIAIDNSVVLLATGAGFAFLTACAWYNRRIGYRKERPTQSAVDEAIVWLEAVKNPPSLGELRIPAAKNETETEQLLRLNSALGQTKETGAGTKVAEPVGQTGL